MDDDFSHFLKHWLGGLLNGLENIDKNSQEIVLRACGRGCATSYTAGRFREIKQQSADLDAFLTNLAQGFPEASYERVAPREIRVTYSHCACDLVRRGFTRSPILCQCSAYNLQANFEGALAIPVEVTLKSSILRNADACFFEVLLQDEASF